MKTEAVIFETPEKLSVGSVLIAEPEQGDLVIDTLWSGISTGTERLLWKGEMPDFPGMGYPLVPGYETVGEVVDATGANRERIGERVFVPGSAGYREVRGLFGGAASRLVVPAEKAVRVDQAIDKEGILYALAATAFHAIATTHSQLPELVVGYGVLGRLIARLTVALGGPAPTIWETNPDRRDASNEFEIVDPSADTDKYASILDVSGDSNILDSLVGHLQPGGEIVLAGFYSDRLSFAFPPAFMKEARFQIAAEWSSADMAAVARLIADGKLSLDGLVTHQCSIQQAARAYGTAFDDPHCLKMVLDWKGQA